jgi:ABC-2 type transport system ATP-binding protein
MNAVIEVHNLTRHFGLRAAVDHLTFTIGKGEVFGMLGPNGAGKTTTVRLLNGLLAPTAGSARVLGLDPVTQGDKVRAQTGVLTESPSLYEQLSARENLRIFAALYGIAAREIDARVDKILAALGLIERAHERAGGYSKGMKQRLALARSLLHEPEIVFLDEPTAALDPEVARQVLDLIEEISREEGRTVILCTHNLPEAQRLCSRVAVLNQGRVLAIGNPAELGRSMSDGLWVDLTLAGDVPTLDLLRGLPGLLEVREETSADGKRRLAFSVTAEDAIPSVVSGIVSAGGQIIRVAPREHSLEEIYFAVQGKAHLQDAP